MPRAVVNLNQAEYQDSDLLLGASWQGTLMFARNVTFQIKPNQGSAFTSKYQKDVLPILRQAPGFRDELTLFRNNNETVGITLWEKREQLDAYTNNVDAQVVKLLEPMTSGTPDVRTYEVSSSTAHKIPVA